jgi:probable phosphoglycerate mutase
MSGALPRVYLVRHGETAWTISRQHTGRTDIPLTERGEREVQALGARLKGMSFAKVSTSPLQRARRTGELAGFAKCAHAEPDLMNGTTARTKAGARPTFGPSALAGVCSRTVASAGKR